MTASLVYQITCDHCGSQYPYVHRLTGDVRWHAEQEGWTKRLERDGNGRQERCVDRCKRCSEVKS